MKWKHFDNQKEFNKADGKRRVGFDKSNFKLKKGGGAGGEI